MMLSKNMVNLALEEILSSEEYLKFDRPMDAICAVSFSVASMRRSVQIVTPIS
jgi:hypothetical protein